MSSLDENDDTVPPHGYWRSLAQLERGQATPDEGYEGQPHEFPASAIDDSTSDPMSRRNLFHLMGASLALAGVAGTGCRRYEKVEIIPLARRPEDETPGVTQQYATAWDFCGVGQALVATSYEGRPIKLDGNPDHPYAKPANEDYVVAGTKRHGGSTALTQASILHLYDPDRSKTYLRGTGGATLGDFRAWLTGEMKQLKTSAARVRVLSEASSSPTLARLREQLAQQLPGSQWYEWEPVSHDAERAGTRMAFGRPLRVVPHLDKARTIVVLDADLFVEHPARTRLGRDWARGRRFGSSSLGEGQMSRMYAVESSFTTTGAVADHRLPLRSELILPFAMALDARLSGAGDPGAEFLQDPRVKSYLDAIVEELGNNRGQAIVLAGRRQPAAVHAIVAHINQTIAALGATLDYVTDPDADRPDHNDAIVRLVKEIEQGQVDYLFILGGNPVFDAPADLDFGAALAKVARGSVHLGEYEDETSQKTSWHVPRAHYLESWGDCRTWDGTVTLAQPLIEPMYGGLSSIELISLVLEGDPALKQNGTAIDPDARASLEKTFDELRASGTFRHALHDGYVPGTQLPTDNGVTVGQLPPVQLSRTQLGGIRREGGVEVTYVPSTQTWDGRFANNSWLQELPDFLTKTCWDNYAMVGPLTSADLHLANDTMIKVSVGGKDLEIPCYTMPGQAPYSIALVMGGGRTAAGKVGGTAKHTVGVNVFSVRMSGALDIAAEATVAPTGKSYPIANTVEHWDINDGLIKGMAQKAIAHRLPELVREATLAETRSPAWHAEEEPHFPVDSLWKEKEYPEGRVHAWGMAIDMSSCTGCNSCVVACVAENNIPVVGKKNIFMNREMHWLRIDRYFSGPPDDPTIVHQPLGCVQCENAPCEQVCPVGATIHSSEGLNDMVYNRCIGTRYCLNNCPYKVRRFNFFNYTEEFKEARNKVRRLLFNPDVTVRSRGVMEKCTYCVQRIQNAKITAKNQRVALEDGDIVTACQAACPTEAIVFGDLNDEKSRVRRLHEERRSYAMLSDELNTKPRTHHLARIRNPNPKLESHDHR
jgi:molybdopterin-containing oxidoreductase family iron-sulfur binding subunit